MIGIYKISNPIGEIYIGQSINIERRFKEHKTKCVNLSLKESFNKYGIENHIFEVIEECDICELKKKELEQIAIHKKDHIIFNSNHHKWQVGGELLIGKKYGIICHPDAIIEVKEFARKLSKELSEKAIS